MGFGAGREEHDGEKVVWAAACAHEGSLCLGRGICRDGRCKACVV